MKAFFALLLSLTCLPALAQEAWDNWLDPTPVYVPNPDYLEASIDLPEGFVLTGIGGRVGDNNLTTLMLVGRQINEDGTLGHSIQLRGGSAPNHNLEAVANAPAGWVITGIGMRVRNDNLTTIRIETKEYFPETLRVDGPAFFVTAGSAPLNGRELEWNTATVAPDDDTLTRLFITGFAGRVTNDNITNGRYTYRRLLP